MKKIYWTLYWVFNILTVIGFLVTCGLYLHYKAICMPMGVMIVVTAIVGWLGDIQANRLHDLGEL